MTKRRKLQPIKHDIIQSFSKTKAGSNGKQTKINQDMIIIEHKLPNNLKLFCVCDGHGVNGHHVSNFIKIHLISTFFIYDRGNLSKLFRKHI
jgi:serine/threonine protein phosphatase PrpC